MVLGFEAASTHPTSATSTIAPSSSPSLLSPTAVADHGLTHQQGFGTITEKDSPRNMTPDDGDLERRPPLLQCMLAGGLGGTSGDMLMHSLDTVKTRQQGDPHIPPRYTSLGSSYYTIFRQEGIRRGLYGGWLPALLGSFPGTVLFFGTYEYSKRHMLDYGVQPHVAYLLSGFLGDFAASIVYVPSEVLKTRLQLQGRYNNPYFASGYNYKGMTDAARTIVRREGFSALFHGYKATLYRDMPFSALQFMFYEQGQTWAHNWMGSRDIGWQLELLTGAAAGGLAGSMTCPLDVVKTRLQTQVVPDPTAASPVGSGSAATTTTTTQASAKDGTVKASNITESSTQKLQKRLISTSSPSTHTPRPGAVTLDTSSVFTGLRMIYQTEGIAGWFRGVGPRAVWTSIQSGCMLFLYQAILRQLEAHLPGEQERSEVA
ncbi:mitochondrial carrier domain-containing protein [Sordaria brevicollis]|uniref:Mitochondrial carrier domain-containing protein n=1 Tax=Sordaria brevicollis TaxID=83679 RepID=A0AAE0PE15_SORBR|nr:mitochondrial carrier domain-containing protein [Sordaria brevicollis]